MKNSEDEKYSLDVRPAEPEDITRISDDVISTIAGIELNKMGWEKVAMGEFPEDDRTVVAMTGATISSKAVVNAVYDAVKTIHNAVASSDAANSPAPGN